MKKTLKKIISLMIIFLVFFCYKSASADVPLYVGIIYDNGSITVNTIIGVPPACPSGTFGYNAGNAFNSASYENHDENIECNTGYTLYSIPTNEIPIGTYFYYTMQQNGQPIGYYKFYRIGLYTWDSIVSSEPVPDQPYTPETCDAGDFYCYMRNAFGWAFHLDRTAFDKFTTLKNDISMKPPFGYITGIYSAMGGITNDASAQVFTLEEVTPITDTIFTPIRTALAWLLYFVFGFTLFHRFKDIQI